MYIIPCNTAQKHCQDQPCTAPAILSCVWVAPTLCSPTLANNLTAARAAMTQQATLPCTPAASRWSACLGMPGVPGTRAQPRRAAQSALCSSRTVPATTAVRQFSYQEDPEATARCICTAAAALGDDPSTSYYCVPGRGSDFIHSMLQVAVQAHPAIPQLYSLQQVRHAFRWLRFAQLFAIVVGRASSEYCMP